MEQNKLVLEGPKCLKWKTCKIKSIQDDEIIVKTIAGAISIGAELPQFKGSDVTDMNPIYPRKTDMKVMVRLFKLGIK